MKKHGGRCEGTIDGLLFLLGVVRLKINGKAHRGPINHRVQIPVRPPKNRKISLGNKFMISNLIRMPCEITCFIYAYWRL